MKRIFRSDAVALLLVSMPLVSTTFVTTPAHAQLTPVYGWLRTSLENSMAQALPPYGKPPATTSADKDADKSASTTEQNTATTGTTKSTRSGD